MPRPEQALIQLYRSFLKEIVRQQGIFRIALDNQYVLDSMTPPVNRGGAWHCLIRLHDAWAHFCREAILLSAHGGVYTRGGTLLSRASQVNAKDDPMVTLKAKWKDTKQPYRWMKQGPSLDVPLIAIVAANLLGIDNETDFAAGIGATTAALELKACRNYLAHRHQDTATDQNIVALRQRINAPTGIVHVGELPARLTTGGVTVFEEWCIDLENVAAAALL